MPDKTAWLIERHIGNVLHYWSGDAWETAREAARNHPNDWRPDVDCAIRFADEKSALTVLKFVCGNVGRVAEHAWIDGASR